MEAKDPLSEPLSIMTIESSSVFIHLSPCRYRLKPGLLASHSRHQCVQSGPHGVNLTTAVFPGTNTLESPASMMVRV